MAKPIVSLLDPEFVEDPIGAFARLRELGPLVRVGFPGGPPVWLLTRSEEIKAALSDPRLVVNAANVPGYEGAGMAQEMLAHLGVSEEVVEYLSSNLMLQDGKNHARLRRLVAPAFTVRRIKALRPRIEELSARLLDDLARKGSGDLVQDYSTPLTGGVICELIGIDEADQPQVRRWMDEYANADADFASSSQSLLEYARGLTERRRAEPRDDMISALVQTRDDNGDQLSNAEIVSLVAVLVNGGYHSTAHFIPNAVLTLLENPEQLALLRAKPDMMSHAMEELMRVANPIPSVGPRYATEDMEFAGVPIRKGDALTGSIQSANFDPRHFQVPERCDVERVVKRGEGHLAFGAGPHRCIGAALANIEGEIAIDHLLLQRDTLEATVSRSQLRYRELIPGGARLFRSFPVRL
ncbi:cytochrome P450 family protein [Streptomyces lancefieldiae]|uniref:Cytochrome P450 n=1 Tax=Streptomyces lancefieldiae TaxID=3075520 RepID=A0ABU3B241_9ACTN|nr:cytochrome P450 [Streptomyces sp. DSM 40712]MDT0616519.1 cytochrome P450 [Streptomyces sp. DSM 40712]